MNTLNKSGFGTAVTAIMKAAKIDGLAIKLKNDNPDVVAITSHHSSREHQVESVQSIIDMMREAGVSRMMNMKGATHTLVKECHDA